MGDNSDLKPTLDALAKALAALQASSEATAKALVANTQAIAALASDRSSSSTSKEPAGDHHQDRPPKHWRPEFPRYDDKSDPLVFIKCESFFIQQRVMAAERTWMASYNLQDGAQLWYVHVQETEGTPTWERFKELLNLRYGPPLRSVPLFELSSCRRTGTVEDYQDRFQALLPRAGRLDEDQRVQLFTGGLLPPLSLQVQQQNPPNLVTAMSLARQFELMDPYLFPAKPGARGVLPPLGPRPQQHQAPAIKAAPVVPSIEGRPVRRLNQAEQDERRRLGLCFNFDEKYSRGDNKVCKRLFLLDCAEDDDDREDAAAAGEALG